MGNRISDLRREAAGLGLHAPKAHASAGMTPPASVRPTVRGKFLFEGERKIWIKGVTYGTFRPTEDGHQFPDRDQANRDLGEIAAAGFNAVRAYTPPPLWLLEIALRHGLRVLYGLPWEQHIAFLDDPRRADAIVSKVRADMQDGAGHPAVLCYVIGNEIPASIVRWHGPSRVEKFIHRLYCAVKDEDADALVTYVNFPTTEFLRLPFLDFISFNVYLEARDRLESYLARLQNIAGEKPLLMAEIGLDSRRNGLDVQANAIDWQVRTAFAAGCAGAFAFAWTDEWHRGGYDIEDWDFGLTTRDRAPKPALRAASRAFAAAPFPADTKWPRVSVIICTYNRADMIAGTLDRMQDLDYADYEVIVVDDGSTDATAVVVAGYDVRVVRTAHRGLSAARNTGWQAATGEIVAYIDDDAYPDPHWLQFLAYRFMTGDWAAVGGPNIAPTGDGPIAQCVGVAPGFPTHVLTSDVEAEHIPGCNMAFRRDKLAALGGFDPQFRTAGDDVDVCWALRARGERIGFHAAALNWHHRRDTVAKYWRQQVGYGRAEALLESKWPAHYNRLGHVVWTGRLYARGFRLPFVLGKSRIYGGVWGSAAYQSLYEPAPSALLALSLTSEWYLVVGGLVILAALGLSWPPLLWAIPLVAVALAAPIAQAALASARAKFDGPAPSPAWALGRRLVTFALHLLQPMARLVGRFGSGLTPWRRRMQIPETDDDRERRSIWSETWRSSEQWVEALEDEMRSQGAVVARGDAWDLWDLDVRGGLLGGTIGQIAVEEHGGGKQMVRVRLRPRVPVALWVVAIGGCVLAAAAFRDAAWIAGAALSMALIAMLWRTASDCMIAAAAWRQAAGALAVAATPPRVAE